ncbi:hypothetical protein ABZW47_11690 [Streptomyces sp. NPDC004549]|uniref:hypothetical protein n=1 Tax=Streptomyces sp. NPDC004549 TaxID=3154283 RepID=UPI0033B66965
MGYSPSLYRFTEGSDTPVPLDLDTVRSVLAPYDTGDPALTVMDDGRHQFWVRASDGSGAEIFADGTGVLVERPHSGTGVFGIVAELAARLGAVVVEPRSGAFLCDGETYARLPATVRDDAVVVELTGEALAAALIGPPPAPKHAEARRPA